MATSAVLLTMIFTHPEFGDSNGDSSIFFAAAGFGLVGAMILVRRGNRAIGWIVGLIGLAIIGSGLGDILEWSGPTDPFWLLWTSMLALIGFLLLLFPTGKPPGIGWRWVLWLGISLELANVGSTSTGCFSDSPANAVCESIGDAFLAGLGLFILLSILSLIVRFTRSSGVERLQLRWLVTSILMFVGLYIANEMAGGNQGQGSPFWNVALALALASIPASIAIAMLRYRLYDIDRIISRTVAYGLVVAILGTLYATAIWLPQVLVFGLDSDSSLAVETAPPLLIATLTLGAAALFNPLRKRIILGVDKRFNRSHFDARQVVEEFGQSLQNLFDPTDIMNGWAAVVSETMQPSTLSVSIK